MVCDNKAIQSIKTNLPGYSRAIERALAENESFRSVCEDFHACAEALSHWNRMTSDEAAHRREEYSGLLGELKREILCWLEVLENLPEPGEGRGPDTDRE